MWYFYFIVVMLKVTFVAPLVKAFELLKSKKFLDAIWVMGMSMYMIIPFIWLGFATSWWVGLVSLIGYMVVGTAINLLIIKIATKRYNYPFCHTTDS